MKDVHAAGPLQTAAIVPAPPMWHRWDAADTVETRMAQPPERSRRPKSAIERAEAVFRPAPPKAPAPAPRAAPIPAGKEQVSLRLDRDVLAHFQDDGPGWQDRINAALRKAAGLD